MAIPIVDRVFCCEQLPLVAQQFRSFWRCPLAEEFIEIVVDADDRLVEGVGPQFSQLVMLWNLPVKVRSWELAVYPRSHIRRWFGVTRPATSSNVKVLERRASQLAGRNMRHK